MSRAQNPDCPTPPGRVLAVDLGSKRIGLAVSDPGELIAQPLPTLPADTWEADLAAIVRVASEREIRSIVVGLPLRMDGSKGKEARRAERFANDLREKAGLTVVTWDERLTSVASEKALIAGGHSRKKRRRLIDSTASILILQSYLDYRRNQTSQPL